MENALEIYKMAKGEVIFNVDKEQETIWATQAQIAELLTLQFQTSTCT